MKKLSALGVAALTLASEYGLAVFPLMPRGKLPLISKKDGGHGFHDATCYPERICEWWDANPDANIGIVPGSLNWVAFDLDSPDAERVANDLGLLETLTLAVVTARGRHLYFTLPNGVVIGNISRWDELDMNVRSSGGYVVAPPSIHPSGDVYHWHGPLDEVAPVPAHVLDLLVSAPILMPATMAERETAHAATMRTLVAAAKAQGYPDDFVVDALDRRVRRYLERVGQRAAGEGRNNAAFLIARWLLNDFGTTDDIAWAYLSEWNTKNSPPLPDRELDSVFKSAHRSGQRPAGCAHRPRGTAA